MVPSIAGAASRRSANSVTPCLPRCFDSYIALSARAIKVSVSSASIVHTTPTLALSSTACGPIPHRCRQGGGDSLGDFHGPSRTEDPRTDHQELVATQPTDVVPVSQRALDLIGRGHNEQVARGMAEVVVHRLEPVKVDEDDGMTQSVVPRRDRLVNELDGRRSVEARCQLVDRRLDLKLLMETRSIGHVTETPHRPVDHAGTVGEGAKTEQTDPVLHGHRRGLSGRHAQTDLHTVNRLACEGSLARATSSVVDRRETTVDI